MHSKLATKVIAVQGMSCSSCEIKIENILQRIDGVEEVKASLARSEVIVKFDPRKVELEQIKSSIQKLGYSLTPLDQSNEEMKPMKHSINPFIGSGIIIFVLYWIIKSTIGFNFIPKIDQSVGYGILFVMGLLTSLHCIAMCGGINLSQTITYKCTNDESKWTKLMPSLLYNTGRVISYTLIGGLAGALGSVISFSGTAKGIVAIIGGIFMVIIGINMFDIFPWIRKFRINTPKFFGNKIYNSASKHGPFYIGLLNGLMPCGPLQTMQLYALGTGSFLAGATSMFLFSLGTVPLMFSFGAISSFLSTKFTRPMLKVSAVLVIILGLIMVNRGLSLSGITLAAPNLPSSSSSGNIAQIQNGLQVVTNSIESGRYQPLVVQKGIPVRWIIKAKAEDLNGCNNPVTIPKYNIQKRLIPGDNIIEFTPEQEGTITYTCWMGMISSYIKVVPDVTKASPKDLLKLDNSNNNQLRSSCSCCGR